MHRRTSYTGEIPIKEDHMIQARMMMQALSASFGPIMGPNGAVHRFLPGPYRVLTPAELSAEGSALVSLAGISIKLSITTPGRVTVRAPLALVQKITLDGTEWSDLGIDGRELYIVGFLESDFIVDLPLPADPGGGDVARQIVSLMGRVRLRDSPVETVLYYNEADLNNPLVSAGSKERRAELDILVNPGGVAILPATPAHPAISGADALIANIVLRSDGAFDLTGDIDQILPSVADVFGLEHHSRRNGLAGRIGVDSLHQMTFFRSFGATDGATYDVAKKLTGAEITVVVPDDGVTGATIDFNFNVKADGDHTFSFILYIDGVSTLLARKIWMKGDVWTNVALTWYVTAANLGEGASKVFTLYVVDGDGAATAAFTTDSPLGLGQVRVTLLADN